MISGITRIADHAPLLGAHHRVLPELQALLRYPRAALVAKGRPFAREVDGRTAGCWPYA